MLSRELDTDASKLHLATCTDLYPHISLMNYTYLESHPFPVSSSPSPSSLPSGPLIIMTTNPSSRKTINLTANPNVSLLVHDWVSARPPTAKRAASPTRNEEGATSSLAALLMGMNSAEMGKISATINGTAAVLERGSEVEAWCQEQHLRFNGFSDLSRTTTATGQVPVPMPAVNGGSAGVGLAQLSGSPNETFDFGKGQGHDRRLEDAVRQQEEEDVRVVVVRIRDGRIADWNGRVRDFVITGAGEA